MAKELPLSKARFHDLLSHFRPGVSMEMVGGYDTGVYFAFKGKALRVFAADERIVGGRIVKESGFCSEGMMMSHDEQFAAGGPQVGIDRFFSRCETRKAQLSRWLAEFDSRDKDEVDAAR